MGPRTAEAQRRVAEQRYRIDHSLDSVGREAQSDLHEAQDRVRDLGERAEDQIAALPGMDMLHSQIERHPMTSVIAAFALGIAGGMTMDSFAGDNDEVEERKRRKARKRSSQGKRNRGDNQGREQDMLSAFVGPALGMLGDPLRKEISAIAREGIRGLLGGGNDDRRPAQMAASRRDASEYDEDRARRGAA